MARIFITGSAEGLGQLSAGELIKQGHKVVLHAPNAERGHDAMQKNPEAEAVVTGDLSGIEETIKVAHEVNALGAFDTVIYNAGVYRTCFSQTQLEMNEAERKNFLEVDKELNRVYQQILNEYKGDKAFTRSLKASQRI